MYVRIELPEEYQQIPAKSNSKRKLLLIAGIALILISTVTYILYSKGYIFGESPYATPERTVNTYLDALEDMDSGKMMDCIQLGPETDMIRSLIEGTINAYKDMLEEGDISIKIVDRDVYLIEQTDDTAKVSISYTTETTASGYTQQSSGSDIIDMVKVDDKWLMIDPSYESYDVVYGGGG